MNDIQTHSHRQGQPQPSSGPPIAGPLDDPAERAYLSQQLHLTHFITNVRKIPAFYLRQAVRDPSLTEYFSERRRLSTEHPDQPLPDDSKAITAVLIRTFLTAPHPLTLLNHGISATDNDPGTERG